jgi:serine/threonine protein kinase
MQWLQTETHFQTAALNLDTPLLRCQKGEYHLLSLYSFLTQVHRNSKILLISTFDGSLSALSFDGSEWTQSWTRKFDNNPLLSSTLSNVKIIMKGLPYRMIPSLDGSLYAFNGRQITQLPITADSLLKSSHKVGDDVIAAGRTDSKSFGVRLSDGSLIYECSFDHCPAGNDNESATAGDEVLVVQKQTRGVRVLNPRTGREKWSILTSELKLSLSNSESDCDTSYDNEVNEEESVMVALSTSELVFIESETGVIRSKKKFASPIASVWLVKDGHISVIDPFAAASKSDTYRTGVYIGQAFGQLYIQPSPGSSSHSLQVIEVPAQTQQQQPHAQLAAKPSKSTRPAVSSSGKELAVLENDLRIGPGFIYDNEKCDSNQSEMGSMPGNGSFEDFLADESYDHMIVVSLWYYWKEVLGISVSLAVVFNFVAKYLKRQVEKCMDCESGDCSDCEHSQRRGNSSSRSGAKSSADQTASSPASSAESSVFQFTPPERPFISRFESEYENIQCRGRGGFGVVFEARKKLEAVSYAVKRIRMPSKPELQEKVMREVKALANMHHPNIVRYYTSWTEDPPIGWQEQFDHKIISQQKANSDSSFSIPSHSTVTTTGSSAVPSIQSRDHVHCQNRHVIESISEEDSLRLVQSQTSNDSYVVFAEDTNEKVADDQKDKQLSSCGPDSHSVIDEKEKRQRRTPVPKTFLFIQMELCEKQTLREWLQSNSSFNLRDRGKVFVIFRQIVEAVDYVHSSGLMHRDLKPSNIFFSSDGAVKVGDFGLVTAAVETGSENSSLTESGGPSSLTQLTYSGSSSGTVNHTDNVGTFLYMSPDQLGGVSYSNKVDIFSLGIILYELLVPFKTEMERLHTLKNVRELTFPHSFSKKFAAEEGLLRQLLATNPAHRPSAGEILVHQVLISHKGSDANPSRRRTISITDSGDQ